MIATLADLGGRLGSGQRRPAPAAPRPRARRELDITPQPRPTSRRNPDVPRPDFGTSQRPPRCPQGWYLEAGISGGRA